jgi:hypothetical protein
MHVPFDTDVKDLADDISSMAGFQEHLSKMKAIKHCAACLKEKKQTT